jgi:thiamine biosynthesis protein ThiS
MTRISIIVNGEPRETASGRSVAALLEELGLHPRLVVVEHNREILDRGAYADTELAEGDVLELVHFVGGG